MGARVFQPSRLISGALRIPVAQSSMTHGTPTKSELSDIIHGMGKAFCTRLLLMLYLRRVRVWVGVQVEVRRVEMRVSTRVGGKGGGDGKAETEAQRVGSGVG